MALRAPEKYRIREGVLRTHAFAKNNGAFEVTSKHRKKVMLFMVSSDGYGWEHVSVTASLHGKPLLPEHEEMVYVKRLFWQKQDAVCEFFLPEDLYPTIHKHTRHLWRCLTQEAALPPPNLVAPGVKDELEKIEPDVDGLPLLKMLHDRITIKP